MSQAKTRLKNIVRALNNVEGVDRAKFGTYTHKVYITAKGTVPQEAREIADDAGLTHLESSGEMYIENLIYQLEA